MTILVLMPGSTGEMSLPLTSPARHLCMRHWLEANARVDLLPVSAGNYFGLQERSVAVETLHAVAAEFKRCRSDVQALLPSSEYPALEAFYSRCAAACHMCHCSLPVKERVTSFFPKA